MARDHQQARHTRATASQRPQSGAGRLIGQALLPVALTPTLLAARQRVPTNHVWTLARSLLVAAVTRLDVFGESESIELLVIGHRPLHRAIRPFAANGRGTKHPPDRLARLRMLGQRLFRHALENLELLARRIVVGHSFVKIERHETTEKSKNCTIRLYFPFTHQAVSGQHVAMRFTGW